MSYTLRHLSVDETLGENEPPGCGQADRLWPRSSSSPPATTIFDTILTGRRPRSGEGRLTWNLGDGSRGPWRGCCQEDLAVRDFSRAIRRPEAASPRCPRPGPRSRPHSWASPPAIWICSLNWWRWRPAGSPVKEKKGSSLFSVVHALGSGIQQFFRSPLRALRLCG